MEKNVCLFQNQFRKAAIGLLVGILTACLFASCDNSSDIATWAKIYRNSATDYLFDISATPTSDGGLLLVQSSEKYGYLVKVDAAGAPAWQKQYDMSLAWAAETKTGDIIAGGSFWYTPSDYLMKLDQNGSLIWKKSYASGDNTRWGSFTLDKAGESVFAAGSCTTIAKINLNGEVVWEKKLNTELMYSTYFRLTPSSDNGCIFSFSVMDGACYIGKIGANGQVAWIKSYNPLSIIDASGTADGGCVATGYVQVNDASEIYVMKVDASGAVTWATRLNGFFSTTAATEYYSEDIEQQVRAVRQTADGGYAVLARGAKYMYTDYLLDYDQSVFSAAWLIKLSAAGKISWQKRYKDKSLKFGPTWREVGDDTGTRFYSGTVNYIDVTENLNEMPEGGLAFTGSVISDLKVVECGTTNYFVARTDAKGKIADTDLLIEKSNIKANGIVVTSSGTSMTMEDISCTVSDAAGVVTAAAYTVIDL